MPQLIYDRVCQVLQDKELTTQDGTIVPMDVGSVCVHGDGPNALEVLDGVHRAAADKAATISFAPVTTAAAMIYDKPIVHLIGDTHCAGVEFGDDADLRSNFRVIMLQAFERQD